MNSPLTPIHACARSSSATACLRPLWLAALAWMVVPGGLVRGAAPTPELFIHEAPPAPIYHEGWIDLNKNGVKDPYEDPTLGVELRIDDLLSRMTVDEKTA